MKNVRKLSYAVIAFIIISFTACTQNEDITSALDEQEINATFTVGGMHTRVNTFEKGSSWDDGDIIRLQAFTDNQNGDYVFFTLSKSGSNEIWNHYKQFRWLNLYERHMIYASYPSSYSFFDFELPQNQGSSQGLKYADFINGLWKGDPTTATISIDMKHRMSMVTITYEIGSSDFEGSPSPTKAEVLSKNCKATFDINGKLSSLEGGERWVTAALHDGNKFSAIVTPGKYQTGEVFIRVTIKGKLYEVPLKYIDAEFQEGVRYLFKLKVGKNKMELTPTSIEDLSGWNSEEELNSK